jgi:hypothetical protein
MGFIAISSWGVCIATEFYPSGELSYSFDVDTDIMKSCYHRKPSFK